jgi:hypothetical protein
LLRMNGFDRRILGEAANRRLTFVKVWINTSFCAVYLRASGTFMTRNRKVGASLKWTKPNLQKIVWQCRMTLPLGIRSQCIF